LGSNNPVMASNTANPKSSIFNSDLRLE
jgi:hypothetical protein